MLRYGLYNEVPSVDRIDASCSQPGLSTIGYDGKVSAMTADMGAGQRPDPGSRSLRNCAAFAHGNAFVAGEEILIVIARLDGIRNHRGLHDPFRQELHASAIQRDRRIEKHGLEPRNVLLLKLAHPAVVAGAADCVDGDFGILSDEDVAAPFLPVNRSEGDETMHPIGPQMFFAAGLVIAEDAWRKHDRSIGQGRTHVLEDLLLSGNRSDILTEFCEHSTIPQVTQ